MGFHKKMSDGSRNLVSEKFQESCRKLKIHHTLLPSYNCQGNRQVEACIKKKKNFNTNLDINLALLLIVSISAG